MYRAHNPTEPGFDNMNNFGSSYGNVSDSYTNVTYKRNPGYFEKVGSSACGIFIGILIVFASFPLLFLNEGRAVQTAKSLDEGLRAVVKISHETIFDSNDNHLVHLSGKLKTNLPLTDDAFGIRVSAVKLRRHVEMYQWIEHEHKREYNEGDRTRVETTYSYSTEWKSEVVNSGSFSNPTAHRNPNSFPVDSITKTASPVFVGQFQLSEGLTSKVDNFKTLQPQVTPSGRNDLVILDKYFYRSHDPYSPKVGDIRISFTYAGVSSGENLEFGQPDEVSIIARQSGSQLSAYQTEAGDALELLYDGVKSAKEIFDTEHSANTALTWVLRFVGWLMMFLGFQIMMDILRQIVSFIPIIREIVGLATSIIAFTLASSLALVTIAVGWLRYRPLLAATIFIAAMVPVYLSRRKAEKDKTERKQ